MTREEEKKVDEHPKCISYKALEDAAKEVINIDWQAQQDRLWTMIERNLRAKFIEEACDWLEEFMQMTPSKKTFIKRFKQAMKGGKDEPDKTALHQAQPH